MKVRKEVLENFATREHPIRSSSLTKLKSCPGYLVGATMYEEFDESEVFKAAHTGSAFGKIAEIFHRDYEPEPLSEEEIKECMDSMNHVALNGEGEGKERQDPFPRYDPDKVEKWFRAYVADPRNHAGSSYGEVIVESLEIALELVLPPHKKDPTRKEIVITCHLDQVRRHPILGMPVIWDIKCTERFDTPQFIVPHYANQLSVYTQAWEQRFGEPAIMGGVIFAPAYKSNKLIPNPGTDKKKKGKRIKVPRLPHECDVFLESGFSKETVKAQIDQIRYMIALIRSGDVLLNSGPHCSWCHYEHFRNCSNVFTI